MNELFGLSMDLIMYVLLGLLALALVSVAYVALRNRVMFRLGVRNLPRRRAQTTLIILGLMLSTVIISAAFTTGDTVDRSITSQVYSVLGSLDEIVQLRAEDEDAFEDPSQALVREQTFPSTSAQSLVTSLKSSANIDFVIPAYSSLAVAVNQRDRLSSPEFNVVGLDPAAASGLPDIESLGGQRLALDQLASGELYVNESAADELAVKAGDSIAVIVGEKTTNFRIREVVKDRRLAGAGGISVRREGAVMSLGAAQALFNAPGQLTMIAVSNKGDSRGGYRLVDQAETDIKAAIKSQSGVAANLSVVTVKETGVGIAELGANIFTTFFLVFGLFSIGAGVLLIFLIFVMLAAERKSEMGMARAVGTRRMDIVQTFLSEGMAYNVGAALVGCGLGVLVSFGISRAMAQLFSTIDIDISPHVTARSLIVSYSLGVVLTFLTVVFSSWRVSFINIVRAIRDIPEPPTPRPMWRDHGFWSTLYGFVLSPRNQRDWEKCIAILVFGLVGAGILTGLSGATGSGLFAVLGTIVGVVALLAWLFTMFKLGFMFTILSIPLIIMGMSDDSSFFLLFGLSLAPLGLAMIARSFGANDRLAFTLTGLFLIYIWEIDFTFHLIDKIFGRTQGDIEMFFLSGIMVTVAATFVVVYNSDLILGPLTRMGRGLGALLPSLKMAVAYPLANRARTGMTMAMFCLVVFALTVMSSMNHNFNRLYLSDTALGGWDIQVDENPSNPIGDLRRSLAGAQSPVTSQIDAVGNVSLATRFSSRVCEERPGRDCSGNNLDGYPIWGDNADFINNSEIKLQSRAHGYDSDEAVWRALAANPGLAVVDANALVAGGFGQGFINGIKPDEAQFEPVSVKLVDLASGRSASVKVIGIVQLGPSQVFFGMHLSQQTFDSVFSNPDARRFFVRTTDGANNKEAARAIESALLLSGAQATSLREQLDDLTAVQSGFFYLLQGFMGLGLFVGVAAVGVIAFRTVVERRQQIGMLRAIGYTRGMVGLTFLLESAFIAFMGVLSGLVFAVILAWQLIEEEFSNQGVTSFAVPWVQLGVIAGLAFGFALLMTLIPSRQAARIPIAQALRYE
ncbi:MAG TPA: FtsX-like permease family protein [Dehalococcoidia bacterium]|nr:FtsX-like permease family protein [Dehalococcoidia bacterium]